jgi:hypothetical protein
MGREEAGSVRWCWVVREVSLSSKMMKTTLETSQRSGCCHLRSDSVAHFGAWRCDPVCFAHVFIDLPSDLGNVQDACPLDVLSHRSLAYARSSAPRTPCVVEGATSTVRASISHNHSRNDSDARTGWRRLIDVDKVRCRQH